MPRIPTQEIRLQVTTRAGEIEFAGFPNENIRRICQERITEAWRANDNFPEVLSIGGVYAGTAFQVFINNTNDERILQITRNFLEIMAGRKS